MNNKPPSSEDIDKLLQSMFKPPSGWKPKPIFVGVQLLNKLIEKGLNVEKCTITPLEDAPGWYELAPPGWYETKSNNNNTGESNEEPR